MTVIISQECFRHLSNILDGVFWGALAFVVVATLLGYQEYRRKFGTKR